MGESSYSELADSMADFADSAEFHGFGQTSVYLWPIPYNTHVH